jgi:hypothetical protein
MGKCIQIAAKTDCHVEYLCADKAKHIQGSTVTEHTQASDKLDTNINAVFSVCDSLQQRT